MEKCERCNKNDGEDLHVCPYQEDVNGDEETLCNCCTDCVNTCVDEI